MQGPKFRVGELAGDPIELVNGEILEFGISKDDNDNIRPGRITMKPTLEQNALIAAAKVGIDLLLEDGIMKVRVWLNKHIILEGNNCKTSLTLTCSTCS